MSKRPGADLAAMVIPKSKAVEAKPFAPDNLGPRPSREGKSLTVKLDGALYDELRAYCYEQERATGQRVTHQHVLTHSLRQFLAQGR